MSHDYKRLGVKNNSRSQMSQGYKRLSTICKRYKVQGYKRLTVTNLSWLLKWPIFMQTGKIGTGKNTKSLFFLLGLRTCFESKKFLSNSCPELRYHFFQPAKFVKGQ